MVAGVGDGGGGDDLSSVAAYSHTPTQRTCPFSHSLTCPYTLTHETHALTYTHTHTHTHTHTRESITVCACACACACCESITEFSMT